MQPKVPLALGKAKGGISFTPSGTIDPTASRITIAMDSLPTSGTMSLKLIGDLTGHGITKRWTGDVTRTANGDDCTGRATTHLKFGDFGRDQPRLMIALSVVDDVKLEYDFHFVKQ